MEVNIEAQNNLKPLTSQYWTIQEDLYYFFYVSIRRNYYTTSNLRRKNQVFATFSNILKTRTATQVKSHHQKLLKKHKKIDKFLKYFEKRYAKLIAENENIRE